MQLAHRQARISGSRHPAGSHAAYSTIVENATKAGKALERLLQDDIDLSEESQEQQRIKIYIADALNTLNRIAIKADAMLVKQIEHYQDILVTSQKQGREGR